MLYNSLTQAGVTSVTLFHSLIVSIPLCKHTQKYSLSIFPIMNMTPEIQQSTSEMVVVTLHVMIKSI